MINEGNKLKFLRKFKSFQAPISYNDIIANPDIFMHQLHLKIGDYDFTKFYILKDKFQRMFIGIKNSNTDGMTSDVFKKLIAEGSSENPTTFCLWKDNHAAAYQYNGILSSIISSSTKSTMKKVTISKSGALSSITPFITVGN